MSASKYFMMLAGCFFLMCLGMMTALYKTDKINNSKFKILTYNDSLKISVNSLSVHNGVYEINKHYNLSGPYYKKDKYYTEFVSPNLDSIIKIKESNVFIFIFKDFSKDTVYFKEAVQSKSYFN